MVPSLRPAPAELQPSADPDLDLRDGPDPAMGDPVLAVGAVVRPSRSRRSSRHTHVRLSAALARLHADGTDRAVGV